MKYRRRPFSAHKLNALVSIIGMSYLLPDTALAQASLQQAQEAAARDMSNWVQFPPRHSGALPAPIVPSAHPQPAAPILAPSTTVDSRGWLIFNSPETPRPPPQPLAPKSQSAPPPSAATPETARPAPQPEAKIGATTTVPAAPIAVDMAAPAPSRPTPQTATVTLPPKATEPPAPVVPSIKRFAFTGHSVYSSEALQSHVASWVGQPINIAALERAAAAISALYRQDGWLAKVELPSQDLTEGQVKINIIEAVLSGIAVQTSPNAAVTPDIPHDFVAHATPVNEPLSLSKLERASQLINELPGVDSSLALRPGNTPGQTEAVLTIGDAKPHEGSVMVDNGGSRSTGNLRVTGQATLKGLWQRGDLTSMQWTKSQGLSSARVSYSEPLGASGLRGGVFASAAQYQLALPEFSAIHAHGPSNSLGLELMYPWLRTARSSINWTASLENKRFTNHANEIVASDYRSQVLSTGLNGQFQDPWQGSNSASIQFHLGYLNLAGSPNEASDAAGPKTGGMFNKTRLQWMRQQKLTDVDAFQLNWQSQWASKNLDGSEKLFLGGPQGVRAYPVNEAGASAGHIVNLEWLRQIQWSDDLPLVFSVFKDVGYATVNKYAWGTTVDDTNKYALRGHGLSVSTAIASSLGQSQLKFTWAKRLGLNPKLNTTTGMDQDGTLSINRFWLTLSHNY